MSKRIASALLLSLALASSLFAAPARAAPLAGRGDDSPIVRTITRVVRALGHLVLAPLHDGPEANPPKP